MNESNGEGNGSIIAFPQKYIRKSRRSRKNRKEDSSVPLRVESTLASSQTNINDLPFDCLLELLKYLDARRYLLVCKLWTSIILNHREQFLCATKPMHVTLWKPNHLTQNINRSDNLIRCIIMAPKKRIKSFTCKPEFFFWKMFSTTVGHLTIAEGTTMNLVKAAIDTCPLKYLRAINDLSMVLSCDSIDDWSWLFKSLSSLSIIVIEIGCNGDGATFENNYAKCRCSNSVKMAKLFNAMGRKVRAVSIESYNYAADGDELVDALIERSQLSEKGFNGLLIEPPRHNGKEVAPSTCFPVSQVIRFIENAKFMSSDQCVLLQFDISDSVTEFLLWTMMNGDNMTSHKYSPHSTHISFKFREVEFAVCLNQAPYVYSSPDSDNSSTDESY